MSNSQHNKLKSGIKNGSGITLNLSSNVVGNSSDETSLPYKSLLINAQVSKKVLKLLQMVHQLI